MIRSSRRRRTLSGLVLASLFSPLGWSSTVHADRLADALGIVPDDAVAWLVIPSLSALNADLGDMLDRANRPELAVAGRPIDVIISQFGIAAGFDERGSLAAWAESGESLAEGDGVIAVPVAVVVPKEKIELMNFSIEFLDKFREFHGFFLEICKCSGILDEFGHF